MQSEGFLSPDGKLMSHVGLPPQIKPVKSRSRHATRNASRPSTNNAAKVAPTFRSTPNLPPQQASDEYIRRLNIGLTFSREVVHGSAPEALLFNEIRTRDIYSTPSCVLFNTKPSKCKGLMGRHNAIGDPVPHLPCTLPVPAQSAELRRTRAFTTKPFLKKVVLTEESVAAQTSVASSAAQWDEYVLNKLSYDTADFIVNKHSHGTQRDRLQHKVLSSSKEDIESCLFKESQYMDVEPIIVDRKHGIDQTVSKDTVSSFMLSESDKDTVISKMGGNIEKAAQSTTEQYIPKYLELGKPLERNYMERFMTKAQQKREKAYDPEQEKYVSSTYNRNSILSNVQPFTEDILQGKFSIHNPGNVSKIVFDTHTKYRKNLISCYPQKPAVWGPKGQEKQITKLPVRGHRPWKEYPKLIITTYQRQVLSSHSDRDARTTPGLHNVDSLYESDELTHSLLLKALSQWRTTWYLDNKWRDGTITSIIEDMQDINEHVRITAAIACGAALGYRDDWDLDENSPHFLSNTDVAISGYRTYSPSEAANSDQLSEGHCAVESLLKLLHDKCERVRVATSVTMLAIGASCEKAKQVLLKALHQPQTMPADMWAAMQCLAMENVTERIVVDKLIGMTQSLDTLVRVTATKLLVRLSAHSSVILFMVADELNNRLWIHRYMACKVMQKIETPLNKDILHKLLTVMWADYSQHTRSVAAQTIGVKGYGHVLHEELCCRLRNGNEAERVDALNRIIHLNMMTGRMKSVFLKCLTDDHVSVRYTAAKGAGELKFSDDDVIESLLDIVSDDHSHKVKAAAIEALAEIGIVTEKITKQLVWSAQYQKDPQVRAAACLVLAMLKVDSDDVVNTLRDRLTADADPSVKKASTQALQMLGLKPEKDASLILAIKDAVKKLGSKDAILASIISAETGSTADMVVSLHADSAHTFLSSRQSRSFSKGELRSREKSEDPNKVIECKLKKEKIQAILCAQDNIVPTTKYLWRKDTAT